MNEIFDAVIQAELGKLTRIVPVPEGDLGYGRDLSCVLDISETLEEVDPQSPTAIGQALLRRLITPRGGLPDDPDYGFDVRGALNRGTTNQDLRALEAQIRSECLKDDRVEAVNVTVTSANQRLDVKLVVTPADPRTSVFSMTFAVISGELVMQQIG